MPAYVIAAIEVTNPEAFAEYRDQAGATVARYGGRYLVRGGNLQFLEGDWQPARLTVVEFDSVEQARAWWFSPEYEALKPVRQRGSTADFVLVEGV
jgi:uncharacterized protein (DUF1330 family)